MTTSIDIQIAADNDEKGAYWNGSSWGYVSGVTGFALGNLMASYYKIGAACRFPNITVPPLATITEAHITFKSGGDYYANTAKGKLIGNLDTNPSQIANLADYIARRGTVMGGADDTHITSHSVTWNPIGDWATDALKASPDIKEIIHELVNQAGWLSGNAMLIWLDDHDGLSSATAWRQHYSYAAGATKTPILHIEYAASSKKRSILPRLIAEGVIR